MSLDNLKISPFLVKELYTNALIENIRDKSKDTVAENAADIIKCLGNNSKNILILVNEKNHLFLADGELDFLILILNACGITMENSALVNINNNPAVVYEKLMSQFTPSVLLFFDTEPQHLDFPVQIPQYQVQQYNKQQYLVAPSLKILSANKEEKKQLWNALKKLFGIG